MIKFREWDEKKKQFKDCYDPFTFDVLLNVDSIKNGLISQYSGLRDINNKEIYEGDIVKIDNIVSLVIFHLGAFWAGTEPLLNCLNKLEVISNKYEWEIL